MKMMKKEEILKKATELCEGANQTKCNCFPNKKVGWWNEDLMTPVVRADEEYEKTENNLHRKVHSGFPSR